MSSTAWLIDTDSSDGDRGNWNDCRKHATFPAKRENDMRFIRTLIARTSFEQGLTAERVCACQVNDFNGAPEEIRTPDPQIRRVRL
jgi:hypothetical protein